MKNTNENIAAKVISLAENGKLTCSEAQKLAQDEGVVMRIVGKAADDAGVKIIACQLGCFGVTKEQ
ncbi:MAG TPA: hypothetical protein VGL27_04790 [Negativicutes bacterium]